jgi:hypothetical protein
MVARVPMATRNSRGFRVTVIRASPGTYMLLLSSAFFGAKSISFESVSSASAGWVWTLTQVYFYPCRILEVYERPVEKPLFILSPSLGVGKRPDMGMTLNPVLSQSSGGCTQVSGSPTLPAKLFDPRALTRESRANRFWPVIFVLSRRLSCQKRLLCSPDLEATPRINRLIRG